jgi:SNF2 family DNA or RNA helicase
MDWENKKDVARALIAIYYRQTADEANSHMTSHENGIGFNKVDAGVLTSISKWILNGKPFTDKQFALVRRILPKYSAQIHSANIEAVYVPESCFEAPEPKEQELTGDGLLTVRDGILYFIPNVYPTSQVKGMFRWDKRVGKKGAWVATASIGAINLVTRNFPDVVLDSSITEFEERSRTLVTLPDSSAKSPMMAFQKEGTAFMLTHERTLLGFAPGLGKTITSIFAANEEGGVVLVICPKTLMFNWRNEIKKWLGPSTPVAIWWRDPSYWETAKVKEGRGWIITSYDTAVRHFFTKEKKKVRGKDTWVFTYKLKLRPAYLILDESVMIKNRKAQRTLAMKELGSKVKKIGLLSGSPTTRFYDDMWAQLNIIDPVRFPSYWRFAETYCIVVRDQWGTKVVANKPNAHEMIQKDCADIYMCRTQDQVLDLPPWIMEDVHIPLGDRQYKAYREMEDTFKAMIPEGDVVLSLNVLSQLMRLIQLASNTVLLGGADLGAKWDAAIEMLEYEQLPAIVWTNFVATANAMEERIRKAKYRVMSLTGESSVEKRDEAVRKMQGGDLDVLVAHPGVGKFGLTLTAAHTAIYMERDYNGDNYYQSLYRIRRIGTTSSPHVIHLLADSPTGGSTVDWIISKVLEYRKNSAIQLTSGLIRSAMINA